MRSGQTFHVGTNTTGSVTFIEASTSLVTATGVSEFSNPVPQGGRVRAKPVATKVNMVSAVYAYMQSMRALGKTRLNSGEIARALSLPLPDVTEAIKKLHSKGVKIVSR